MLRTFHVIDKRLAADHSALFAVEKDVFDRVFERLFLEDASAFQDSRRAYDVVIINQLMAYRLIT
ncbi:MAG: hypothetical protein JW795_07990 [Chitinivibrionales bacterium]|nr:hypothetical protein [Chitinivibrionales bacterium]